MLFCDYGCGKKGKYQLKNGKWCCSKYYTQCSALREKNSKGLRESWKDPNSTFNLVSYRKKLSNGVKKSWENPNNGHNSDLCEERRIRKIKESWKDPNSTFNSIIYREKLGKNVRRTIKKMKIKYLTFSKIEEMRYNPDKVGEKEIQVHCKNHKCKNSKVNNGWFTPTGRQLESRIYHIEYGNGGSYFYCCDNCKVECPLYRAKVSTLIKQDQIKAGHLEEPWYNSIDYQTWRNQVFKLDNNKCVWCGQKATVAHHILPQKIHPELSLDPDNGLSCCKDCHYKYGHRDHWCTTGFLAKLVCERVIKIQDKIKHLKRSPNGNKN